MKHSKCGGRIIKAGNNKDGSFWYICTRCSNVKIIYRKKENV